MGLHIICAKRGYRKKTVEISTMVMAAGDMPWRRLRQQFNLQYLSHNAVLASEKNIPKGIYEGFLEQVQ
jgi:hypothetical protein